MASATTQGPSRRSSPSSGRPRRARPGWPSTWPNASAARWSTPTRWRSTAAWTSAPPSRHRQSGRGSRTTCSTPSRCAIPRPSRSSSAGRGPRSRRCAAGAGCPCSPGARRSTRGRSSTASSSRAPTTAVRARLEAELAVARHAAALRAPRGRRPRRGRPDRARQRPPHRARAGGRRDHRQAVLGVPARAGVRRPRHRPDRRRHRPAHAARADRGAGAPPCSRPASSTRCERLLAEGLAEGRTAARAIGYPEVAAYLRGELTLDEAVERTVTATRRFARRQDAWFRKDPRIVWVRWDDPERVDRAVEAVRKIGRARLSPRAAHWCHDRRAPRSGPAARAARRGARRGQPDAGRHGRRRVRVAVPLQPAALPRRRRTARGDATPGDARARRLAAQAGIDGHRRGVRGRATSRSRASPARSHGLRAPAERDRRDRPRPLAVRAQRDPLPPALLAVGAHHGGADEPPDRAAGPARRGRHPRAAGPRQAALGLRLHHRVVPRGERAAVGRRRRLDPGRCWSTWCGPRRSGSPRSRATTSRRGRVRRPPT